MTRFCARLSRAADDRRTGGLTLVEMLVAMSITLLIMAAVVTVFANVSGSVTRRRATIEMSSALRNMRDTLARDLAGATCPAVPWQRPESNVGYLEIIEGPQNDYYPTPWIYDADGPVSGEPDGIGDPIGSRDGIDLSLSSLPGSNLGAPLTAEEEGRGVLLGSNPPRVLLEDDPWKTDGRGLGDADDILMLTVRSEDEPFVGRIPSRDPLVSNPSNAVFPEWQSEEIESQLAEVAWFALENPVDPDRTFAFGEPGYRTIHRRVLLILPEVDYGIFVAGPGQPVRAKPGVVRVLQPAIGRNQVAVALASLIAFQERYDLSVRLEWDPALGGGRWVLRANTLGDLTKPENRFEHHGFVPQPQTVGIRHGAAAPGLADRFFPFVVATGGRHAVSPLTHPLLFVSDAEAPPNRNADPYRAQLVAASINRAYVAAFEPTGDELGEYLDRPLALVNDATDFPATARAVLDEDGRIVHVTRGLAPLGGNRRGDDVMMTDALGFDIRVYDPGAPRYAYYPNGDTTAPPEHIATPGDPAWVAAYFGDARAGASDTPPLSGIADGVYDLVSGAAEPMVFDGQGAYVDLGYGRSAIDPVSDFGLIASRFNRFALPGGSLGPLGLPSRWELAETEGLIRPRFFTAGLHRVAIGPGPGGLPTTNGPTALTQRFATYDTWSWHYESNGINEDGDTPDGGIRALPADPSLVDEGANGLDDPTSYWDDGNRNLVRESGVDFEFALDTRLGPDDYNERETRPPYDTALRGVQVALRVYERDSRQIREVRVRESFVPE